MNKNIIRLALAGIIASSSLAIASSSYAFESTYDPMNDPTNPTSPMMIPR